MSKIAKKIIIIPEGVNLEIAARKITAKGPKGEQELNLPDKILIQKKENRLAVKPKLKNKASSALAGLYRNLIFNLIEGVSKGFEKKLELHGVGYRATLASDNQGQKLVLALGFSHPVEFPAPPGISFAVQKNVVTVSGINKALVGQVAAQIRALRPPEPYKGKGIRYAGEVIRRKAGKAVVKTQGA